MEQAQKEGREMNGKRVKALRKVAMKAYKTMTPEARRSFVERFYGRTEVDPWSRFWRLVKKNWARKKGVV